MINTERLLDVLTYITEHPERHNQEIWVERSDCGTTACLAGWTVMRHGDTIEWRPYPAVSIAGAVTIADTVTVEGDPDTWDIPSRAAHLLGLNHTDAEYLFSPLNTITDLWDIAEKLTGGAITQPARQPHA
jgi:hypothetical protein